MAERLALRRVPSQKSSAPELYQYQYEPMTQAERAFKYRQNLKKDPKKLMAFREKEKERKKKQRRERTKEQIIKDNLASKERQKRYRERQKQKGIKPNKSSASASVLTREKRQKQREYWRIKQRESRSRRTSQKIRRKREKDLRNWHDNKKTHIKKTYRPQISAKEDFFKQTSEVFKEIVKEKKARNMLVHRFSFLKKYGLSKQLSKYTGISESIISRGAKVDSQRKTRSDATSDEVKNKIQDFMQRPEVSTSLPSSKRVKKDNIERKVLDRPVKDLHSEFKDLHPNVKISLSTFKRNRPENIESTRKQYWEGCLCEVCENVENKLKTLNNLAVKKECSEVKIKDKYEAVGVTMCEKQSQFHEVKCINRQCMECGVDKIVAHFQPLAEKSTSDEVTYTKWERVKKNVAGKEVVRVMPITKTATITSILIELSQELETLSRHLFVASWQQKQFTTLRKSIPEGTVILNMDFAENFSCVAQNEVQAAHWGHEQVTIHPTVSYYNCPDDGCDQVVTESLIFISPDKVHDSHAVNTFTQIAVEHLKEKRDIDIQRLIEMTDGCSSQYKSKIPFTDISCSMIDYGFPTERHFYGSRHGKGPSDGAGAVVKSFVRRGVMGGNAVVNNAEDFYEYAKKLTKDDKHSKRTLFYTSDIDRNRPERTNKKTLVGTRKLQCVKTIQKDKIATRNLSCFCQTCLNGGEAEGCENHSYVDGWTAYELQSAGAATRVGDANNGTRVRVRGRQNQLRVGARTRGGIVRHGESRPIRNRVAVRTRGGVGVRQGDGRPGRTIVRGRTRGRGNARYRPDQESTSSSDQEESFDSDSSSDQGEVSDSESSLDQGESEDLNHCRDSYIAEQTEKVETDEEEFSDIADIADISGINTILDYLQSEEVNLQFDIPQSLIQVQEEDDNYKAEGILKTSTDIPPMENDNSQEPSPDSESNPDATHTYSDGSRASESTPPPPPPPPLQERKYPLISPLSKYLRSRQKSRIDEEASELLLQALGDILVVITSGRFYVVSLDQSEGMEENRETQTENEEGESSCKKSRLDQQLFHSKLRCTECGDEDTMRKNLKTYVSHFTESSGVLLYLYSILLTKGIEQIKNEVEDPGEPLIDGIHGHGSQSLINLLICGRAVTNVWDNDKDVSGLKLHGVSKRASIGFLTYMEHLRYCEVGWHLKNPIYPVWLIGSETHLTVLFSKDPNLVINESIESIARRMFHRFDPEDNGFIASSLLGDLMSSLDLVSEKEYVDIMVTKLDSENLGIITRSSFMEEFFAGEKPQEVPKNFSLYHYNGLSRSCQDNKVKYLEGKSVIQDELEVQILTDVSQIKMVLLTKWPTIEIKWSNEQAPSIN